MAQTYQQFMAAMGYPAGYQMPTWGYGTAGSSPANGTIYSAGADYSGNNFPTYTNAPSYLPPTSWADYQGNDQGWQEAFDAYWQNFRLPYMQMAQNAYQYGQDLNWEQQQFNQQFPWQQFTDQSAIDLANRQQNWNETWAPQQQQNDITWQRESQANQLAYNREAMKSAAENEALEAWGRRSRPNTRYM